MLAPVNALQSVTHPVVQMFFPPPTPIAPLLVSWRLEAVTPQPARLTAPTPFTDSAVPPTLALSVDTAQVARLNDLPAAGHDVAAVALQEDAAGFDRPGGDAPAVGGQVHAAGVDGARGQAAAVGAEAHAAAGRDVAAGDGAATAAQAHRARADGAGGN